MIHYLSTFLNCWVSDGVYHRYLLQLIMATEFECSAFFQSLFVVRGYYVDHYLVFFKLILFIILVFVIILNNQIILNSVL